MRTFIKRYLRKRRRIKAKKVFIQKTPFFKDYERIYHVHIRKSAGTSINSAFWGLAGYSLESVKREPIIVTNDYVFVRNHKELIEEGFYFYGNSHIPFWKLDIPEKTFVFCMLRDPYKRLVSLYKYLHHVASLNPDTAEKEEPSYKALQYQLAWLGDNFSDFLDYLPKNHLQRQLYTFSEKMDASEALENVNKLDRVYFQEDFEAAIADLSKTFHLKLTINRERSFNSVPIAIDENEKQRALQLLEKEYQFYNRVLKSVRSKTHES